VSIVSRIATIPALSTLVLAALVCPAADQPSFESRKANVRALLDKQDFEAALDQAKTINQEWPDDIAGYQLIVEAQMELGNYTEAERALQWMLDLRIGKADAGGWLLVARFRETIGDIDGAMDAVNAAYGKLSPAENELRVRLLAYSGHLQFVAGKLENADRVLRECLAVDPASDAALDALAALRIAQNRREEAREILVGLARSGNPRYLYGLAEERRDAEGYAAFERAARARMTQPGNANRELVLFYAGPGKRPDEALEIARREAAGRHDVLTLDALAVALQATGNLAEARSTMQRVLEIGARHPEILRHAAELGLKAN
jgi:cytochrome c-type biogenesis protein CcmH/NrfG